MAQSRAYIAASEEFARILGIYRSTDCSAYPCEDEFMRFARICQFLIELREKDMVPPFNEEDHAGAPLLSHFCAHYLHKTIEGFLTLPPAPEELDEKTQKGLRLFNGYSSLLIQVASYPYLRKYYLSSRPAIAENCRRLVRAITERFLDVAPLWERDLTKPVGSHSGVHGDVKQMIANVFVLLADLIVCVYRKSTKMQQEEMLPRPMIDNLVFWVDLWSQRYDHDASDLGHAGSRVLASFSDNIPTVNRSLSLLRRRITGMDGCGLPGCKKSTGLKECARCQTIRYCSVAHQHQHWKCGGIKSHKHHCFATVDY